MDQWDKATIMLTAATAKALPQHRLHYTAKSAMALREIQSARGCECALHMFLTHRGDAFAEIERVLADDPASVLGHCVRAALIVRAESGVPRSALAASIAAIEAACPNTSGAKRDCRDTEEAGPAITQSLPADLAAELLEARARVKRLVAFDEQRPIPAWQRYDGALYGAGRRALADLMAAGIHVIILSGGYGAVLAQEPIGRYEARLKPSWWPNHLIERVLIAYAQRQGILSVRAFVSSTGPYVTILKRVGWRAAGIDDALLLTPQAELGAMRRSPATQGEALAALRDGTLSAAWRSTYGLALDAHSC